MSSVLRIMSEVLILTNSEAHEVASVYGMKPK